MPDLFCMCLLAWLPGVVSAQEGRAAFTQVRCKGISAVTISLPLRGYFSSFELWISRDGETFDLANAGPHRGAFGAAVFPGNERLEETTMAFPLVGRFGFGMYEEFLFEKPGTYYLRWVGRFRGEETDLTINQTILAVGPSRADRLFISRLGGWVLFNDLMVRGKDLPFDDRVLTIFRQDRLLRTMGLLGPLMETANDDNVEHSLSQHDSMEEALVWADAMNELAFEIPESSFAPYAAYYAGTRYTVEVLESRRRDDGVYVAADTQGPYHQKAEKALALAIERGDAYLKPRALVVKANLFIFSASWDRAEQAIEEALHVGASQGAVHSMVAEWRKDMASLRRAPSPRPKPDTP